MPRAKHVKLLMGPIPPELMHRPDFMERLDQRTNLGRSVLARYEAVIADLGGDEALTSVKRSLVRRFTWLEIAIEGVECRAASGEEVDVGTWTQLCNSWLGIARILGLERKQRRLPSPMAYIAGRASAPPAPESPP